RPVRQPADRGSRRAECQSRRPRRGGTRGGAGRAQNTRRNHDHGWPSPRADVATRQARRTQGWRARSLRSGNEGPACVARRHCAGQPLGVRRTPHGSGGPRMKGTQAMTFAGLLAQRDNDRDTRGELTRLTSRLLIPVVVVTALVAVWATTAPLSGAVVASGQVKVELNRKTVQHQEGGIVREIRVRNGQKVHAGEALVIV